MSERIRFLLDGFRPHLAEKHKNLLSVDACFAHYTSAETAFNIIKRKEIWFRNTNIMNDVGEVKFGADRLRRCLDEWFGNEMSLLMEGVCPGVWERVRERFSKDLVSKFMDETYIHCLSEYDEKEDPLGRLSMWRAYGGSNGVALLFDRDFFLDGSDQDGVASLPVGYISDGDFNSYLRSIINFINENMSYYKDLDKYYIEWAMGDMLRVITLATKHVAFLEEKEWRLVHTFGLDPEGTLSPDTVVIAGVPQKILKFPLVNMEERGINNDIKRGLKRVVIGPTNNGEIIRKAFVDLLAAGGFENPENMVDLLSIPLRI